MDDIEWPKGLVPYKTMFYLQPHIGGSESPLTRTRKVYGLSAPRWVARLTFRAGHGYGGLAGGGRPRTSDPAFYSALLDALIAEMQGGLRCVRFYDFRRPWFQDRLTGYGGPPTVDAASAGDTSIVIRRPSQSRMGPSVGDYIGGDGRPHLVTRASPMNGSMLSYAGDDGLITLQFQPPLSQPIGQDSVLDFHHVTGRFRLVSEDAGQNEAEVGRPAEYVLDFVEALE